ncbi:hypothetical protein ACTXT7_013695, partial [Hymenolepis weldensis]
RHPSLHSSELEVHQFIYEERRDLFYWTIVMQALPYWSSALSQAFPLPSVSPYARQTVDWVIEVWSILPHLDHYSAQLLERIEILNIIKLKQ